MEQGTNGGASNQSLAAWKVWLDEFLADDGNADSAQPAESWAWHWQQSYFSEAAGPSGMKQILE